MHSHLTYAKPFVSEKASALTGSIRVAGDKSISHRSLILGSQIIGRVRITGLLEGDDVMNTKACLQQLGTTITHDGESWVVEGKGVGGLSEPSGVLNMGNSGTGARLMMGLVASYPFTSFFMGDESLSKRPMQRVITPLSQMGAQFQAHSGNTLPLSVTGLKSLMPISYELPVASAQIKSAILLAGLNTSGITTVIEPIPTRDHTERMMEFLGFHVTRTPLSSGGFSISITGQPSQTYQEVELNVPADPSSAAFPLVAAAIVPGSDVTVSNVCMNPLRTGLFTVLERMGADISYHNQRIECGEPVADIRLKYRPLNAVEVEEAIAPSMIDEYPILAVAAACANGVSTMHGLGELRVKESDRLQAIADGLLACGVKAEIHGDSLTVHGTGGAVIGGGRVVTHFDHRIAMAFLVLGLNATKPITVDDSTAITTSFPTFTECMQSLGAAILPERRSVRRIAPDHPLVIAIDGPAASGKGTLARKLADHYGLPYLDTGSIYRAVGMRLVHNDLDPHDVNAAVKAARQIDEQDFANPQLRQERVGQAASIISAMPEVRAILLDFQRQFAANSRGAILDGRDIGTVVCPNADLKLFMTATLDARAHRRHVQLQGQGIEVVFDSVKRDLIERDTRDSQRHTAPLTAAPDAVHLDTTSLNIADVFVEVVKIIEDRKATQAA